MEDKQIIELFYERSDDAVLKTAQMYGKYLSYIAYNILYNKEDSEECVNDTYLRAWNSIPPQRPDNLQTFLGKITRNLALDKYKYYKRNKRGGGQMMLAINELDECIPSKNNVEQAISDKELTQTLNSFIAGLPAKKRQIFVRRYWYLSPIYEIAKDYDISESNVKIILHRIRNELKLFLKKEGVAL